MADETTHTETETEQARENPATAHQPAETVTRVYDAEGREHFASPTSKFVVDGLADGTLTEQPPATTDDAPSSGEQRTEEVPSGAEAGSAGHDHEPGTGDRGEGSGDGATEAGTTGGRRRAGKA